MNVTYKDVSYLRSNEVVGYKMLFKQLLKLKEIYESHPTVWELIMKEDGPRA